METAFWPLIITFLLGYTLIIVEGAIHIDKAATALLTGVVCWIILFQTAGANQDINHALNEHLAGIAQILFFLMGAMLIVEVINVHRGFELVGRILTVDSPKGLFWGTISIGFVLSSVLDNLTSIIVLITLLQKIIPKREERLLITAALVTAVNIGGAWTPIGDVTTTMLWINGNITTFSIIKQLWFPCVASLAVFGLVGMRLMPKKITPNETLAQTRPYPGAKRLLYLGIATLIAVPLLKALLGVPPFMGILIGVGIMWIVTDLLHRHKESHQHLRVYQVLTRVDMTSILFFLGILLAVDALETAGILKNLAAFLSQAIPSQAIVATLIGIVSAVVDNVPLVAASMKMYPLSQYPVDDPLWALIAFCAGVGGSLLIIGSAPGIALMSLEKVSFGWYLRKISLASLVAYLIGIGIYVIANH